MHSQCGSSSKQRPEAGKRSCVQGCGVGLLGLQRSAEEGPGTATGQQVPSRTPNGHSRRHKEGSELSGAATLSSHTEPHSFSQGCGNHPGAGPTCRARGLAQARPSTTAQPRFLAVGWDSRATQCACRVFLT